MFKKVAKWIGIAIVSPIVLFFIIAILLYIPPIQNFVVDKVADKLSESMKMKISIDRVRLAFPLDLSLNGMLAVDGRDTVIDAKALRLNVELMPLFDAKAVVDGFGLYDAKVNTKDFVSDTRIVGKVGELTAYSKGVEWKKENVLLNAAALKNADVQVFLSDTAKKDTTPSTSKWKITVDKVTIDKTIVHLVMPGDSMRIGAQIGSALLHNGLFDTGAKYYSVEKLKLRNAAATYDIPYKAYTKGFDYNHIGINKLQLDVDTFSYDSSGHLKVGIPFLRLQEKSGLTINEAKLALQMDTMRLRLPFLVLQTPYSRFMAKLFFDFRVFTPGKGGTLTAIIDAALGHRDVEQLVKPMVPKEYWSYLPKGTLYAGATLAGNLRSLKCKEIRFKLPGILSAKASGYVSDLLKDNRRGNVNIGLNVGNSSFLNGLLPTSARSSVHIPSGLSTKGKVIFAQNDYKANLKTQVGGGSLSTQAHVNLKAESYEAKVGAHSFPISSFLPGQKIGRLTATINARGKGFDPLSVKSNLLANAHIQQFSYDKYPLNNIQAKAQLKNGKGKVDYSVNNAALQSQGSLLATITNNTISAHLANTTPEINFKKLGVTSDTLDAGGDLNLNLKSNKKFTNYSIDGSISNIHVLTSELGVPVRDIQFGLSSSPDTTHAFARSGDMDLAFQAHGGVDKIGERVGVFTTLLQKQLDRKKLDYNALKKKLPAMKLYIKAGNGNPILNYLRMRGYDLNRMFIDMQADPENGINGTSELYTLKTKDWQLDTISLHMFQDSSGIRMQGQVLNAAKNNPDKFDINLDAYLQPKMAGARIVYLDSERDKGLDLGVKAEFADSGLKVSISPDKAIIAYRTFNVNHENYIFLGKNKQIYGNVDLLADDGTGLKLYGEPNDSVNDITVSANHVNLGELSNVIPYMPKLNGLLDGDFHLRQKDKEFTAMGSIQTKSLAYEGIPLGNVGADVVYLPSGDKHQASAYISSNGQEVLFANGTYNTKNGGNFEGSAELTHFPFALINGFMAGTNIAFGGYGNGTLNINGSLSKPQINGELKLDSTCIYSDMYGFNFHMDNQPLTITDSHLMFKDFDMYSTGKNPMVVNGDVDLSDFSKVAMDLNMKANNFELINTKRKQSSMIFGKVYSDYLGTLKGTTDNLRIRGKLSVLDGTDMTYILKDSPLSTDDQMKDLVKFVNFKDSTATKEDEKATVGGVDITLGISISDAAHFHCDLSDDKQSYVDLEGGGDLTMRMSQQGDMRMTGKFTVNSGEMKYALPVIPLKTFQLVSGSYVNFTGDVANPTLSIAAKERVKTIITENDVPRSVAFDVGLALSQPLQKMGLEFTIEAPEDLSIQNQLAAMTREQRGKVAVSMLATGMYLTDGGNNTTGFKANNALNAFLQSEIQNIAGNALKTIDLNVGVESGTSTTGTTTTDYSFQFAKRFWGNRVSVIVGGKVKTGADAQNSAESFIDNVSLEYRLDKGSTRYVKVFYDRSSNDPLEGLLTKTGAGIVLRKKSNKLGELFIFRSKKKKQTSSTSK